VALCCNMKQCRARERYPQQNIHLWLFGLSHQQCTLFRWRAAIDGLNVEGRCQNQSCSAHGELVIDRQGMISFALHADHAHCPECRTQFQPETCAFSGCLWAFDGRKEGSNGLEDVSNDWTVRFMLKDMKDKYRSSSPALLLALCSTHQHCTYKYSSCRRQAETSTTAFRRRTTLSNGIPWSSRQGH